MEILNDIPKIKQYIYDYLGDNYIYNLDDYNDNIILRLIYLLLNNGIIDGNIMDHNYLNIIGIYYIIKSNPTLYNDVDNYVLAEKYFIMAIDKNNIDSIHNLAVLYYINRRYQLAEKYFLMAINKSHTRSMNKLALYYEQICSNYQLAEKYYLMAVEKKFAPSMNNLGLYYEQIDKNYQLAEKYYLMAIELKSITAMFNLADLYNKTDRCELAFKYYLMGANYNHMKCINNLNKLISSKQNIIWMNQAYSYLNDDNINLFNNIICKSLHLLKEIKNNKFIIAKIECICCMNIEKCVFLNCGHAICCECMINKMKCRLCNI